MILDSIEDEIKISMRKEDASANIVMDWSVGKFLDSFYDFLSDVIAAEFMNEFIVIDFFARGAGDSVGIDNEIFFFLFFSLELFFRFT